MIKSFPNIFPGKSFKTVDAYVTWSV